MSVDSDAAGCAGAAGAKIDGVLGALLDRRHVLIERIERRSVEVVRAWMVAHERTRLGVDVTKSLPGSPFDEEDGLVAGVGNMPHRVFRWGGEYSVSLADVNEYLGRPADDRGPLDAETTAAWARIELITVRDPDGGTDNSVYVDGQRLGANDFDEYVVDAGRGHSYADWIDSRDGAVAAASPAAAEQLREAFDNPPGYQDIDDAPEGWPFGDEEES